MANPFEELGINLAEWVASSITPADVMWGDQGMVDRMAAKFAAYSLAVAEATREHCLLCHRCRYRSTGDELIPLHDDCLTDIARRVREKHD